MNYKDFITVLDFLEKVGGKYIIIEDKKPSYILMSLEEYKRLVELNRQKETVKNLSKEDFIEKINKEIALWNAVQKEKNLTDKFDLSFKKSRSEELSYYYDAKHE